jgi:acid phosphatase (class A)
MNPVLNGIQLTDLIYGSPTQSQKKFMDTKGTALRCLLESKDSSYFFNKPFPSNISVDVRRELEELQNLTKNISPKDLEFAKKSETDHYQSWVDFLYTNGINVSKSFFETIENNTNGLIYALKYHYNRPRPFQLGEYHRIPVHQTITTNANSPAYPSGHAFEARLFGLVLSEKYQFAKTKIQKFAVLHAESRLNAGVHYRSDMNFGHELADWVFSQKCF